MLTIAGRLDCVRPVLDFAHMHAVTDDEESNRAIHAVLRGGAPVSFG